MTLPLTYLPDWQQDDTPGGAERVWVTLGGKTFEAGRRTAAHIEHTIKHIEALYSGTAVHIMQSCYHTGYSLSEGTHDGDGVIDFRVYGMAATLADWWEMQYAFRALGWAAWFRHTGDWSSPSAYHIHAISLGCPGPVGFYIPSQVDDYLHHALGLEGQHEWGGDTSRFPEDIRATWFDYADTMAYRDWPEADRNALVRDVVEGVLAAFVDGDNTVTLKQATNQTRTKVDRILNKLS